MAVPALFKIIVQFYLFLNFLFDGNYKILKKTSAG